MFSLARRVPGMLVLLIALVVTFSSAAFAFAQGGSWQVVASPNQGSMSNELLGVAATSTSDLWAVGDFVAGPYVNTLRTTAEHWDGTAWSIVPTPNPGTQASDYDSLQGVAAVASNDAWAVGYSGNIDLAADRSLTEHWNGTRWRIAASPNPYSTQRLYGVAAVSSSDAWAVGQWFNDSPYGYGALIEHWNGTSWKAVHDPATSTLHGVAAASSTDVWAVGQTKILHWNGTKWRVVPSPQPGYGSDYQLQAVAAVAASDVWAVGYVLIPSGEGYTYDTLTEHWNGSAWKVIGGVEPNPGTDLLFGVTALSSTSVWAVGTAGGLSFVERWGGNRWTRVTSPNVGTSNNTLQAAATVPASGDLWAVGEYYEDVSPYQAQTLVQDCAGC